MRLTVVAVLGFTSLLLLPGALEAQLTALQKKQILDQHNQARCTVDPAAAAMPALVWDPLLEQVAQNYANLCSVGNHNPNRNADYAAVGGSGQVGENISWGTTGFFAVTAFVQLWIDEEPNYNLATNTCLAGQVCGHYTQVVWANTTRIGCGLRINCSGQDFLVCDYAPAGNFVGQRPYTAGSGLNESCAALLARSDFNADAKSDIVLRNYSTGQDAVWLMNGTALSSIVDLPALVNVNWRIEGTADFNTDGKTDILLRNYLTGQNAVWIMNGTTLSSIVDLPALPNIAYHIEGTGDFNGDSKPDIILRNNLTGQNAVWLMNGTTFAGIVDLPTLVNTNFQIESSGDFNADGRTDIVLRNYATGQNALWLMNGTALASIVDLPALTNVSFRIEGVADFNADAKPDIVLRNYTTGQDAVWLMNGTALSSIVDLPALTNISFEINGPR